MNEPRQVAAILGRRGVPLSVRFVALAAIAVGLMLADHRQNHLDRVRDVLNAAVYPALVLVDFPFSTWESLSDSMATRRALIEENERLELELRVARVRSQNLESLEEDYSRLRRMIDALESAQEQDQEQAQELRIRMADILQVDLDNRQHFLINRGTNDGVYECQPLLDAEGVVGQVIETSARTAKAILITDASHGIQVENTRTQQRTIAQGTGDSRDLRLLFVTNDEDFAAGDLLVTTGYGGIFPPGRPVATVTHVDPQPGKDWASVRAAPVADLDRIQEVLLVWDERREGRGCAADPAQSFAGLVR
jgi:rod shape-determining protein MreC